MRNIVSFICLLFVCLGLLCVGISAFAGSANCSNVTHIHESPSIYYNASLSDCIISVERTSFTSMQVALPANPSSGAEFTVIDATPYQYDHCDQPFWDEYLEQWRTFCYPAAVSVVSYNDTHLIDGVNEIAMAGSYEPGQEYRMGPKFVFNGSAWESDIEYSLFSINSLLRLSHAP